MYLWDCCYCGISPQQSSSPWFSEQREKHFMDTHSQTVPGRCQTAASADKTHQRAHLSHTTISDACLFSGAGTCRTSLQQFSDRPVSPSLPISKNGTAVSDFPRSSFSFIRFSVTLLAVSFRHLEESNVRKLPSLFS